MWLVRRTVFIGSPLKWPYGLKCAHTVSPKSDRVRTRWRQTHDVLNKTKFNASKHASTWFWACTGFEPMLFCTNHRFGPIGQRSIGSVLKHVLKFWTEGKQTDGLYTRSVWTDETEPWSILIGFVRPCVRGLNDDSIMVVGVCARAHYF